MLSLSVPENPLELFLTHALYDTIDTADMSTCGKRRTDIVPFQDTPNYVQVLLSGTSYVEG